MTIRTEMIVGMTDANQNFSKVVKVVDENGMAVIVKNNKPKYVLVDFNEYDEFEAYRMHRAKLIQEIGDAILEENDEAFKELAK
ncbi:MAG: type II toxin-antitoxin system Phd/YefM family antitoxin [bacterium]